MHNLIYFCDYVANNNKQEKIVYNINNQEELNILTN